MIDWTKCPDVERSADTLHGAWRVRGHRVRCQDIIDNAEAGCSAEEIAHEIYDLDLEVVRRILDFAACRQYQCAVTVGRAIRRRGGMGRR
jgi:uncharacterized protein (DUF433 family)